MNGHKLATLLLQYLERLRLRDRPSHIGGAVVDFGTFYMSKRKFLFSPTRGLNDIKFDGHSYTVFRYKRIE